ncbi:4Fe-4S dicluster domain-containing protein [Vibrio maerlii]|uniref:4Fe-4S dicluster domain-containing protein n=1 Tax=Vibrio maerlii TaxID=2231648 RepID=UPI0013E000F1|nr:4Fe-4S dicluster domain-containing protein [Vibrio maerlii]
MESHQVTRRDVLSLFSRKKANNTTTLLPLPPKAIEPQTFDSICNGCGLCVATCPNQIIYLNKQGKARVDLDYSFCNRCFDCVEVCDPQALSENRTHHLNFKPQSTGKCSNKHDGCGMCLTVCKNKAINLEAQQPAFNKELCDGCGECKSVCIEGGISLISS